MVHTSGVYMYKRPSEGDNTSTLFHIYLKSLLEENVMDGAADVGSIFNETKQPARGSNDGRAMPAQ